jgi:fumarate hydratase class II
MSDVDHRIERDSMGEVRVPVDAYWGAQTQRARDNFQISSLRLPPRFIAALARIKLCAARANGELGLLPEQRAAAIAQAAGEVVAGRHDSQFVVDVFQTGSGTSTNMNANEVIAKRACEIFEARREAGVIHPNDDVNRGQSSNDVIPSAIHVAARLGLRDQLLPALARLAAELRSGSRRFDDAVKPGRTHLQDAAPVTLGQEFGGWATQVERGAEAARRNGEVLEELALGGTAVGTGLNAPRAFVRRTLALLSADTGIEFREVSDHFAAQGGQDAVVGMSGALRQVAVVLAKVANDIRLLGTGPRCGLGEIRLPALQPGSSIMPGKVNPVICEAVTMVAAKVIGNDAAIGFAGAGGQLELNTYLPLLAHDLLQSIELLTGAADALATRCIAGIEAERERGRELADRTLALATALVPHIGYDAAAELAKEALARDLPVIDVARERALVDERTLRNLLDPLRQTQRPE